MTEIDDCQRNRSLPFLSKPSLPDPACLRTMLSFFFDRDPHCNRQWVKQAIHLRILFDNIRKDKGIEIPKPWTARTKKT